MRREILDLFRDIEALETRYRTIEDRWRSAGSTNRVPRTIYI